MKAAVGTSPASRSKEGLERLDVPVLQHLRGVDVQCRRAEEGDYGYTARQHVGPELARAAVERTTVGHAADGSAAATGSVSCSTGRWHKRRRRLNLRQRRAHTLSVIVGGRPVAMRSSTPSSNCLHRLGITDATALRIRRAFPLGRLWLTPAARNTAKIGDRTGGGQWAGEQLLPSWMRSKLQSRVSPRPRLVPLRHRWWTLPDKRGYMAVGFLARRSSCCRDRHGGCRRTGCSTTCSTNRSIASSMRRGCRCRLPRMPRAVRGGRAHRRCRRRERRRPRDLSSLASAISGKTYRFAANVVGLRIVKLHLTPGYARYDGDSCDGGPSAQRAVVSRARSASTVCFAATYPQGSEPPSAEQTGSARPFRSSCDHCPKESFRATG